MKTHLEKTQANRVSADRQESQSAVNRASQKRATSKPTSQLVDNRPEALQARELQQLADNNNSPQARQAVQLQGMADDYAMHNQSPVQKKTAVFQSPLTEDKQNLSAPLIASIRELSGKSINPKVKTNSSRPAELNAHAITQGNRIDVAYGQEKYIPHEAWHVVQQLEGRVKPTMQMKGANINDDPALEKEADVMGAKAEHFQSKFTTPTYNNRYSNIDNLTRQENNTIDKVPAQLNSSDTGVSQRVVEVNNIQLLNVETIWMRIFELDPIRRLNLMQRAQARSILKRWIRAPEMAFWGNVVSEYRGYPNNNELAQALYGEVTSADSLRRETQLASQVKSNRWIKDNVGSLIGKLKIWHNTHFPASARETAPNYRDRNRIYYGATRLDYLREKGPTVGQAINNPPQNLYKRIAVIIDYSRFIKDHVDPVTLGFQMNPHLNEALMEEDYSNANESANWTINARHHMVPVAIGPSYTSMQALALASYILGTAEEVEALAWGLFSFFNQKLDLKYSGTHRFHEVMPVARMYHVPYTEWVTPNYPPHTEWVTPNHPPHPN